MLSGDSMLKKITLMSFILSIFLLFILAEAYIPSDSYRIGEAAFVSCIENIQIPDQKFGKSDKPSYYSMLIVSIIFCLLTIHAIPSDSNKNPLTIRQYRKSVYQACHPASNFG